MVRFDSTTSEDKISRPQYLIWCRQRAWIYQKAVKYIVGIPHVICSSSIPDHVDGVSIVESIWHILLLTCKQSIVATLRSTLLKSTPFSVCKKNTLSWNKKIGRSRSGRPRRSGTANSNKFPFRDNCSNIIGIVTPLSIKVCCCKCIFTPCGFYYSPHWNHESLCLRRGGGDSESNWTTLHPQTVTLFPLIPDCVCAVPLVFVKVAWKTCQISHVRGFLTASTLILQASNVLQSYQQLHCKKRKKSKLSQVLTFLLASSGAHSLLLLLPSLQSPMRVPPYLMPLPFSLFRLGQGAADDVEKEVKICIHGAQSSRPFSPSKSHTE